jgi:hypothetical protein
VSEDIRNYFIIQFIFELSENLTQSVVKIANHIVDRKFGGQIKRDPISKRVPGKVYFVYNQSGC